MFTAQGSVPIFHQSNVSLDVISLSNDNTITGTTIQGGRDGIAINNATGFRINRSTLRDNGRHGIGISADGGNHPVRIENNVIRNTGTIGVGGTTTGSAIHISAIDQSDVDLSAGILGNEFDSPSLDGVSVSALGGSTVRVGIRDNIMNNTGGSGIVLESGDTGKLIADVIDNTITGSIGQGIQSVGRDASNSNVIVRGNRIDGLAGTTTDGIELNSSGDAEMSATIDQNDIRDVDVRGIFTRVADDSSLFLSNDLSDNIFSGSTIDENISVEVTPGARLIQAVFSYSEE